MIFKRADHNQPQPITVKADDFIQSSGRARNSYLRDRKRLRPLVNHLELCMTGMGLLLLRQLLRKLLRNFQHVLPA